MNTRPEKLVIEDDSMIIGFNLETPIMLDDKIIDYKIYPILKFQKLKPNELFPRIKLDYKSFTDSISRNFDYYSYSLGKMIRLSELIYDNMKIQLESYLVSVKWTEIINRNSDCKKLKGLDRHEHFTYNQIRSVWSCILKTDEKFHVIENLKTVNERNAFTKTMHHFIEDRNKYVHGTLSFLELNTIPVLKIKKADKKIEYVTINENVIWEYFDTFKYLNSTWSKINGAVFKMSVGNIG